VIPLNPMLGLGKSLIRNGGFGGAPAVPWTPVQLSTALWLDAADASTLTLNGSTVSQWRDKSGNARHVAQATAANQPTRTLNGLAGRTVLTFDGADWLFNATPGALIRNVAGGTMAAVISYSVIPAVAGVPVGVVNPTPNARFNLNLQVPSAFLSTGARRLDTDTSASSSSSVAQAINTPVIQVGVADFAGNSLQLFANGTGATAGSYSSGAGNSSNTDANTLVVGGSSPDDGVTVNNPHSGFVGEVVITNTAMSTDDRQRLEGYLAWKWGLVASLPVTHPYRLSPPFVGTAPFDADAQAYIIAVEAADGQTLEPAVRTAINDFVVGCKNDGIWTAIGSSCILAGARTLAGALVPLRGTAPTNFNFVSGDYNRKTGLIGNGTTKYLDSNRNNNTSPQNNFHAAVHVTQPHTAVTNTTYLGVAFGVPGISHLGVAKSGVNDLFFRVQTIVASSSVGAGNTTGFIGASRLEASSYNIRFGNSNTNVVEASEIPHNGNLLVFGRVAGQPYVDGRIAFYSIGQSLNLAQFDSRVTALINAYGVAIP
jgi:hypothetical protein